VAEEQVQRTPLINPESIKSVVKAPAAPAATEPQAKKPTAHDLGPGQFCWGTGRRKTAIARVRLRPGSGKIVVNGKEAETYFSGVVERSEVKSPLEATNSVGKYDIFIDVNGGGKHGQAGAAKLGLARALCQADPDTFGPLRDKGFLTRDGRMKERKKYGQKGARKRFQFSKR
jgi:small subunit ribosomal protein S9